MTAFARDPAPTAPGLRTLGTGANQAAAGNDTRLAAKPTQTATYQTYAHPANVYFKALATDGTTVLVPRTTAGVVLVASNYSLYGYPMPVTDDLTDFIAVWDEGDVTQTTAAWESVGASSRVVAAPPPTGNAVALFTATQSTSSVLTVNGSTSTGDTYAWEIDSLPRPETTASVTYGPLTVGTHHVKLTVTSIATSTTDSTERDVNVAWVAEPFNKGQNDNINGLPGPAAALAPWSDLVAIGPWRNKAILNEQSGGDGEARLIDRGDGSWSMLTKTGDQPSSSSGYKQSMEMNTGYDGSTSGYPLATAQIDASGNIAVGGTAGAVRFIRYEYNLLGHNPDTTATPTIGTALTSSTNNFGEVRGAASSISTIRPTIVGGNHVIAFRPYILGVAGTEVYFDSRSVVKDAWNNYVFEYVLSTDPAIGYVRVYRDGSATTGPAGTDGLGRYFAQTAQTQSDGTIIPMALSCENYRTKSYLDANVTPDMTVAFRNIRMGPTMASVMAL